MLCQMHPPGDLEVARMLGQARILAQEPQQAQAVVISAGVIIVACQDKVRKDHQSLSNLSLEAKLL
jgi:hypothetical protein